MEVNIELDTLLLVLTEQDIALVYDKSVLLLDLEDSGYKYSSTVSFIVELAIARSSMNIDGESLVFTEGFSGIYKTAARNMREYLESVVNEKIHGWSSDGDFVYKVLFLNENKK